jgi:RimJ/RimL family protein N-acetyltransferase
VELRPYRNNDLGLTEALETDPVVKHHLGGVLTATEAAAIHRHRLDAAARGDRFWTVRTPEPAGIVGIWSTPWAGETIDEVGWMLLPAFFKRGIGKWAAAAVIQKAVHRDLHAFPAVANVASNAICRSLAFHRGDDVDLDYAGRPLRCAHWVRSV